MADPVLKDLGLAALRANLATLGEQQVTIGHQGNSGSRKHPGTQADVAQVAAWMEFGTPGSDDRTYDQRRSHIPSRPFVRTTFDQNQALIDTTIRSGISDLIDGRKKIEQIQKDVGEVMLDKLRLTLDRSRTWAKALAQTTIDRKGHDQPLFEGGTLRRLASWAVRGSRGGQILKQGGEL